MSTEKKPGPSPTYGEKMKKGPISMPPHLWSLAEQYGDGNRSKGVRRAIEKCLKEHTKEEVKRT